MARFKSPICEAGYRKGVPNPNRDKRYYADTYTRAEITALLDECNCGKSGIRDRALIVVLWRTGIRVSEALGLRPHDIDFERGILRVRGTKTRTSDRTVGMDAMCANHLRDWLDIRRDKCGLPPVGYVFCAISRHEVGNQIKPAQTRQKLHRLSAKAGIEKRVHPHGFRHTFAAEMADERQDLRVIQRSLGHSNLATTDRYISHLNPTAVIDVMTGRT